MKIDFKFLEEYKYVDNICRDSLSTDRGVYTYISEMEMIPGMYRTYFDWSTDYRALKRVHYLRNRLSHEPGTLDTGLVTNDDLKFITEFHNRLLRCSDPLALARKRKEELQKQREAEAKRLSKIHAKAEKPPKRQGLLKRLFKWLFGQPD